MGTGMVASPNPKDYWTHFQATFQKRPFQVAGYSVTTALADSAVLDRMETGEAVVDVGPPSARDEPTQGF